MLRSIFLSKIYIFCLANRVALGASHSPDFYLKLLSHYANIPMHYVDILKAVKMLIFR